MTGSTDVADVLERAALLLEKPGAWTQDSTGDSVTTFCLASAVGAACGDTGRGRVDPLFRAVRAMLVTVLPQDAMPLVAFNDAPERTQAEVVAALRQAARKARQPAQPQSERQSP